MQANVHAKNRWQCDQNATSMCLPVPMMSGIHWHVVLKLPNQVAWLRALHTALCWGQCFFWQSQPQYAVNLHPAQALVFALPQTTQGFDSLTALDGAPGGRRISFASFCIISLQICTAWTSHTPWPQSAETVSKIWCLQKMKLFIYRCRKYGNGKGHTWWTYDQDLGS